MEALVGVLKGFKNSTLGREQEVFACMVHNLFDEYRFFPKYPDKELHTTGELCCAVLWRVSCGGWGQLDSWLAGWLGVHCMPPTGLGDSPTVLLLWGWSRYRSSDLA